VKRLVPIAFALLLLFGCSNLFGSKTTSLKDIRQSGQLQYTFAVPRSSFAIGDTLDASVTVLNKSSAADTVFVGGGPSGWNWRLLNTGNTTVMLGGWYDFLGYNVDLAPNQPREIYKIRRAIIADTSGHPIQPGYYVLKAKANGVSLSLGVILK